MIKQMRDFLRSIKYGIENLIIWFPIIWKDRDWDHWYLYKILKFKLSNMEKLHRKYGHAVNSEKIANKIKVCVNLLDRLIEDNYDESAFKKHHKKWGEPIFHWDECEDKKGYYSLKIEQKNIKTKKDKDQEAKEFKRCYNHEEMLRKQDVDYLFKLMNKHIQGWWD